jgi:capsular polysaccharide biosynthesis protein
MNPGNSKEINIRTWISVLKKRAGIIAIFAILTLVCGLFYIKWFTTPLYQSSATIIIEADADLRNTLQVIIKDSKVMEKVGQDLGLSMSPEDLAEKISVTSIDNSQVVNIGAVDQDPRQAADIANTTARIFKEEVPSIINFDNVHFLSEAKENFTPINEDHTKLLIAAFGLGVIVGIGFAFLLDSLNHSIRSTEDLENLIGIPVVGRVSKIKRVKRSKDGTNSQKVGVSYRGEEFPL